MAKIEIQLTLKPEKQETTFLLCKNEAGFYLKGYSSVSGEKEIALKRNENTKVFELKQNGIFNQEVATSFRELLSQGDSIDAAILYRNFRGHDPEPEALLKQLGIIN